MILHWNDLVTYYGPDIEHHKSKLMSNKPTTYALFCCSPIPGEGTMMKSADGEHAEERLVLSEVWREQVPRVMELAGGDKPIIFTLAINRAPCGHCARVLAEKLKELQFNFAVRFENTHFLLASRGNYHSITKFDKARAAVREAGGRGRVHDTNGRYPEEVLKTISTGYGLDQLSKTGWKLCVLQFETQLPPSGEELLEYLRNQRAF